jgi:hypothetical protein
VAALWIPELYREPLTTLAKMDDDDAGRLVAAIAALDAYSPMSTIQDATGGVLGEQASAIEKQMCVPLLALRGQMRLTQPDEIARRLSESVELELDDAERAALRSRAAAILATPVYETTAVATDLQTQNGRNFQSARIVTDIRPVFRKDLDAEPSGAVIVETLQIQTWTRDGDSELLFVSMDEADLKQLEKAVDRALHKTKTLRKFIAQTGLTYFELEKEAVEQ